MIGTGVNSFKRRQWVMVAVDEAVVERLAHELRVPGLLARLLVRREIVDTGAAAAFLQPKYRDLHSPWELPNMTGAAERIAQAVREKQKITLYGDYDVDGITGTAMLWHTLRAAGVVGEARSQKPEARSSSPETSGFAEVEYYIPHRVEEGYGLNCEAIERIANGGTKLLITIDCGCSAAEPIRLARERGMDVVVSDHHEFGSEMPAANFIVHPRATDHSPFTIHHSPFNAYPNPDLCGAGVAFKLCWAVAQKLCNADRVNEVYRGLLMEFAALAALGTIADVVPLVGENRILVKYGLAQLARTRMEGLKALILAAGYGGESGRAIDCTAVGFGLAPRLNAAGRMGHAREAVELLTTATGQRATEIANWLEEQNKDRQKTERKMVEVATAEIETRNWKLETGNSGGGDSVIVVSHPSFHVGVVGIVASRIAELYHRPTFVLSTNDGEAHGSARSVRGFELHAAIEHARDLLISGGGHAMAGGVKMAAENVEAFRERLLTYGDEKLTEDLRTPCLELDGVIGLEDCVVEVMEAMESLAPFGRGNPRPQFLLENAKLTAPPRRVGATGTHLQLTICQGKRAGRCIAFKMGAIEPELVVGMELNLVVEPKVAYWNGRSSVDLVVVDLARADGEALGNRL
ncbi:MAG: single-stranded-DNA-specific exonuclease RecJ [Phycisphaerales bacterium]|nr:single-stranded-DNA-specific exonuclease RecJ [Phycisphaerales bacterium]